LTKYLGISKCYKESLIVRKHGNIILSLIFLKGKLVKHIKEIPTNKGANSYKLTIPKIGN